MEFKHYIKEESGYTIKNPSDSKKQKAILAIFVVIGLSVLALINIFHDHMDVEKAMILPLLGLGFGLLIYFLPSSSVYIQPKERIVVVKNKIKSTEYPFDQFVNFETTRRKVYGVVTVSWGVSMYFNENQKNKQIYLTTVRDEKTVNEIIAETSALLNLNDTVS